MIGYSSEIYNIEIDDILVLDDYKKEHNIKQKNDIIIKIDDIKDTLVCGREKLLELKKQGHTHAPVKIVFTPKYNIFKFYITLIKKLRSDDKRIVSSNIYHINPLEIRKMGIERAFRTQLNAYDNNDKKKHAQKNINSKEKFKILQKSIIEQGYNDEYPMNIMLCRNMGVQDTLNQGHHRMDILVRNNITSAAFKFSAVGYIKGPFKKILKTLSKIKMSAKYKD